jgi:SAM-dependent methyltransferase
MGGTDHFSAVADGYAAARPDYPPEVAGFLAQAAPGRRLAWEAGCGSGQFTGALAALFDSVRATDLSAAQIARAPRLPNVVWAAAPAQASGLPDGAADLIVAAQAAHWFDLPAFYAEVRRVARPGGLVALVCYGAPALDGPPGAALARFHDDTLAPFWPAERAAPLSGYRDLPFPFAPVPAPAFAIVRDWDLPALLAYVDTWSALRALEAAGRGGALDAFRAELAAVWGAPGAPRRLRWPVTLRVGRV